MTIDTLNKRPLIEAICEIRWEFQNESSIDNPNKQISLANLLEKVQSSYPVYEAISMPLFPLPGISVSVMEGFPLHRFRVAIEQWPLVQVGVGIVTINETEKYTWENFSTRVMKVIQQVIESHSQKGKIKITSLVLKYVDALDLNIESQNIYDFLREKLNFGIAINPRLVSDRFLSDMPSDFNMSVSYNLKTSDLLNFKILRGQKRDSQNIFAVEALILETTVISTKHIQSDSIEESAKEWLEEAHNITHDWFFTLVDGDLLETFK
ncbi:TIGR04255 family protein [Chamaesiphon sp. OTE_75_metabat_556]|uniref:TIGR04255 family protein n=1 Tax=Chamaesiphon sp. OTE_75_metabat_556 TaxID=2964692 RepID=UPI00286A2506|nr:TIGR04255 family protein [Chamaesiphon sp. OTE_75_metabat_556]